MGKFYLFVVEEAEIIIVS